MCVQLERWSSLNFNKLISNLAIWLPTTTVTLDIISMNNCFTRFETYLRATFHDRIYGNLGRIKRLLFLVLLFRSTELHLRLALFHKLSLLKASRWERRQITNLIAILSIYSRALPSKLWFTCERYTRWSLACLTLLGCKEAQLRRLLSYVFREIWVASHSLSACLLNGWKSGICTCLYLLLSFLLDKGSTANSSTPTPLILSHVHYCGAIYASIAICMLRKIVQDRAATTALHRA